MKPTAARTPALVLALVLLPTLAPPPWAAAQEEADEESRLQSATFAGLELRGIGPALMSGRIADIAIHPEDPSTWIVGVGSGGVWKTTNSGTTWESIFDGQGSYSIGCVTIDPSAPNTIWVGSGENVGGRHVGYGDGVYKSVDGGASWKNVGLPGSGHIGRIVVHPEESDTVWVAAQGPLWSGGGERGVYKTTDGGESWRRVLGDGWGPYTGANDVVMHPERPDVLWAAAHQRLRTVGALINGGPESGIYKTTDGGESWREVESGLPEEDMGRIGLAVSPQDPDVVYATIELAHREGGFHTSTDGGESWEKGADYISGGTGPHYYQEIVADPHHEGRVYQMDVRMHVTHDAGGSFTEVPEEHKHSDNHALAFHPTDPDYLLAGSDGGLYESWDQGKSWKFVSNLPVTQFYKVAVDYDEPFYNVYGGTQDNNTQGGPSRTANVQGIRNADWFVVLFGDGHQPAVDPTNPDIVYAEWQQGNLVRFDRRTHEIIYIQPQPDAGEPAERFNWDAPILISPHDPARLYYASQRVWRSDDRGDSWRPVSGDLSKGLDRFRLPMMDRVWSSDAVWDLGAMSNFGTITSLSESPLEEGLLWVGTDDGLIQVSGDGGGDWRAIPVESLPGVPENAFVNDIKADLHDADTVYVALDHHKEGDDSPYLYRSADRGATWQSIVGDLPERHLIWRLVQDHERPELLFAGTEFGVFFSLDGGGRWIELSGGPTIPYRDLAIQRREDDLVGATFGRGFQILDDYSPLRGVSEEMLEREAALFPVRDAHWYVEKPVLGFGEKASQGAAYFTAPNPPFGAVFTYYLREVPKTAQAERREREEELAEKGEDTPYPGWEALQEEEWEEEPALLFTVRDADGAVVRRLTAAPEAGIQRIAWDLRYPNTEAVTSLEEEDGWLPDEGPLAPPGTYTVTLARRVEGAVEELAGPVEFEVARMLEPTLEGSPPAEAMAFTRRIAEVRRRYSAVQEILERTDERLALIQRALLRSTVSDPGLRDRARELETRLRRLRADVEGNQVMDRLGEPQPHTIGRWLQAASMGNMLSTYGPTPNHEKALRLADEGLAEASAKLARLVEVDLVALEERLAEAGVPWTPGRGVPGAGVPGDGVPGRGAPGE